MTVLESPIHQMIHRLREKSAEGFTLGDFFSEAAISGHSLLILFCALPFLQPLPLPGLSTPLGILIVISSIGQLRGHAPWIPERWKAKPVSGPALIRVLDWTERSLNRVETLVHPRWTTCVEHSAFRVAVSAVLCIAGILLALPLPVPLSDKLPAYSIALIAFGQLEEDGLLIALGLALFVVTCVFFGSIAVGVATGLHWFMF